MQIKLNFRPFARRYVCATALQRSVAWRVAKASKRRAALRRGALQTMELLFVLPVLLGLLFAIIEFGFLWSANVRVKQASFEAARVASLPAVSLEELETAIGRAVVQALADERLVAESRVDVAAPLHTGDPVSVEVRVPMSAAAPDLLALIGFELQGRTLTGRTVMRKE